MRVEELIIDGFKSYSTRTVVSHWDPQFNAITGLNGSGKSNILDAICFVLGIASMATVRASNLQDLIYKRGQAGVTKASVTIVFNNFQKETSPIGFENIPKISVTRQITLGGVSKYLINGHRAQQQSVLQLFQSVQLNINNPNFLIMQGKITKVLNMRPREILALIEEAAGTRMFEDRRKKAEKTMLKKDAKLLEIKDILSEEVEPKLRRFQQDKEVYLQFQEIQLQLEQLKFLVAAHDYSAKNQKFSLNKINIEKEKKTLKALTLANMDLTDSLKSLSEELESTRASRDKLNNEINLYFKENNEQVTQLTNELSRLDATKIIQTNILKEDSKNIKIFEKTTKQLEQDLHGKVHRLETQIGEHEKLLELLTSLKDNLSNKNELFLSLNSSGSNASGYTAQINKFKKQIGEYTLLVKKNQMKIKSNQIDLDKNANQIKQSEDLTQDIERQIKDLIEQKETLEVKMSKFTYDTEIHQSLKQNEQSLKRDYKKIQEEVETWKRKLYNLDFQYDKENVNFDPCSVKGVAATLFNISSQNLNKAQALQVCAGGRLFNVIVDNEKTGAELLERGNLKKRVTIIPLNKISARKLRDDVLKIAKDVSGASDKVDLALNLIGYEKDVARAMEFIFGSSLICETSDIAKKVTFHPQIKTKSITLDGDVYDPEGTLSGGSRNNGVNILVETQNFNKLLKKQKQIEIDVQLAIRKFNQQESVRLAVAPMLQEFTLTENKIEKLKNELENSLTIILMNKNLELKRENKEKLEANLKLEKQIKQLTADIEKTELDLKNFNENKSEILEKLEREIKQLELNVKSQEKQYEAFSEIIEDLQMDKEQLEDDINNNKKITIDTEANIIETKSLLKQIDLKIINSKQEITKLNNLSSTKNEEADLLNQELNRLNTIIKDKKRELEKMPQRIETSENLISAMFFENNELDAQITNLVEEFDWVEKDPIRVQQLLAEAPGFNLSEAKPQLLKLKDTSNSLKNKVNPHVISMIESVLKRESALRTMITTIEADKKKIEDTIETLNQHKIDTLLQTYKKVTVDFGNIFKELLPNSFAKLVLLSDKPITEGLEVKVKLGAIWKESLVELSGGQRSLVALSLILALLQFKPAPMYILDEVDAALDLSHTQNIGHLIKTRFKGSQFIVVSLKEGMFTNANRVFRTRFQDGTSTVSIMT
ncbi:hypothetical protein QEN19_000129 [Hanseniaspora menglaensis]